MQIKLSASRSGGALEAGAADAVAIGVSENPGTGIRWRVELFTKARDGHRSLLAKFLTAAVAGRREPNRIVCIANCPGTAGWYVQVTPVYPAQNKPKPQSLGGFLWLQSSPTGQCCGAVMQNGSRLYLPGQLSGTTEASATLPPGADLVELAVTAGGAGGTAALADAVVGAFAPVTVLANQVYYFRPTSKAPIEGPATFNFSGLANWVVDYEAP